MRGLLAGVPVLAALPSTASAAAAYDLVPVPAFSAPMDVAAPPGDGSRIFVAERAGTIRVVRDGEVLPEPFLDLSPLVATEGERGLLSLAFAPDYAASGRFFVFFTAVEEPGAPRGELRVVEYRRSAGDPDAADPGSGRLVISQEHAAFSNHNGGDLAFGPDGHLYVSWGDGGGNLAANGQDLEVWQRRLLRR